MKRSSCLTFAGLALCRACFWQRAPRSLASSAGISLPGHPFSHNKALN